MYALCFQISDNHVIKYIPAEELIANSFTREARLAKKPRGALIVGADSGDPRLVRTLIINFQYNFFYNYHFYSYS